MPRRSTATPARRGRRARPPERRDRRAPPGWRARSDLGSSGRLVPGALEIEFGGAEHRVPDIPELRINRVVEQLVGSLPQVSEPGRAAGPGAVADHPGDRRDMGKAPPSERVFQIDQLFAQLVQLGFILAVLVYISPRVEHR